MKGFSTQKQTIYIYPLKTFEDAEAPGRSQPSATSKRMQQMQNKKYPDSLNLHHA